jgi:menaquinone-dependent protoporphyrinogen oxidase
MSDTVLVTYATKYGATAEIAQRIGQVLLKAGLEAEVMPVKEVKDPARYRAVVLGSAVYIGQWRKDAASFVKSNREALSAVPVWIFSSGPTGQGDPEALVQGWRYPSALEPVIEAIKPRDIAVFHGMINLDKFNFLEKAAIKNIKAPLGDWRDWDAIEKWAQGIAESLKR